MIHVLLKTNLCFFVYFRVDIKEVLTAPELLECEESSLIESLKKRLLPQMTTPDDEMRLRNMIRDVFPSSARPKSGVLAYPPALVQFIKDQLKQNNLQCADAFLLKVRGCQRCSILVRASSKYYLSR